MVLTDQGRADIFRRWFCSAGHWVYDLRAKAVETWRTRGIVNLPDHTPGAEALLAEWVAADPLPALIAKWDAERAAGKAFMLAPPVDPAIGAVLSPTMAQAIAKRREEYRAALAAHNWTYGTSEDPEVYARGVTERGRLDAMARSLDPQRAIWNEVAPAEYRCAPYVSDGRRSGDLDFGAWALPGSAT